MGCAGSPGRRRACSANNAVAVNNNATTTGLRIVHLHIPKTAGSTFNQILRRRFPSRLIYEYQSYFNDSGYDESGLLEARDTRLVALGHMDFRCRPFLPAQALIVSFLRDPVERVLSGYYNVLRDKTNPVYAAVREMSLGEYVDSGLVRDVDNGQVRRIAGLGMDVPFGAVGVEHLAMAMRNIAGNAYFIGITERFDESLVLLEDALGIQFPNYVPINTGNNRPRSCDEHDVQIQKVRAHNRCDQQLYDAQLALMEQRIAAAAELPTRLRRYRSWQPAYRYISIPQRLASRLRNRLRQMIGK